MSPPRLSGLQKRTVSLSVERHHVPAGAWRLHPLTRRTSPGMPPPRDHCALQGETSPQNAGDGDRALPGRMQPRRRASPIPQAARTRRNGARMPGMKAAAEVLDVVPSHGPPSSLSRTLLSPSRQTQDRAPACPRRCRAPGLLPFSASRTGRWQQGNRYPSAQSRK